MQIYHTIADAKPQGKTAVALGFFDGLHLGHQAVIAQAASHGESGLMPCVFTFDMQTMRPTGKNNSKEIITHHKKYQLLSQWGIALVLSPEFTEFQGMSPEEFVEQVLVHCLKAQVVCCGYDFRFGHGASAGVKELEQLCSQHGIQLDLVSPVLAQEERISSTRIRNLLQSGELEQAAELLGRPFSYDFVVAEGKKLGRKLDFPTINQWLPENFVTLPYGVYVSAVKIQEKIYPAVTSIGVRPTTDQDAQVNSETYIHHFSGDLYGQSIEVAPLRFMRPEYRFDSVETLRAQIQKDAEQALILFSEEKDRFTASF